jgi:hypothetical protein
MLIEYVPTKESILWLRKVACEDFVKPYEFWGKNGLCDYPLIGELLHEYELPNLVFMLSPPDDILKEMFSEYMPCPMDHIDRLSLSNLMLNHCADCLPCNITQIVMLERELALDRLLYLQSKVEELFDMGLAS